MTDTFASNSRMFLRCSEDGALAVFGVSTLARKAAVLL